MTRNELATQCAEADCPHLGLWPNYLCPLHRGGSDAEDAAEVGA
jgi:hypothetical protein